MLNLCVCIPIHLHTILLDQWCDLDLDSDFIIPFAMEFPFRTRTLCVPHTQMQAYYEHLFSISFVFQLIVSNGMRTHKFYASIKWKNESLPTHVWIVERMFCSGANDSIPWHPTDIMKAWMKYPGPNGMSNTTWNVWRCVKWTVLHSMNPKFGLSFVISRFCIYVN